MNKNIKHIAIAGNIGAGKTTLCTLLGKHFGWDVHYESTDDNPYLSDFYEDMQRWSFNLQIFFLNSRYKQILDIRRGDRVVVQDRTIYEDANIFAPNLHNMGLMSKRDFENYISLFDNMLQQVSPPDLLIYLRASVPTLQAHIQSRGRDYERSINPEYLALLNQRYEDWINNYKEGKLLVIEVDQYDFETENGGFQNIVNQIEKELFL